MRSDLKRLKKIVPDYPIDSSPRLKMISLPHSDLMIDLAQEKKGMLGR